MELIEIVEAQVSILITSLESAVDKTEERVVRLYKNGKTSVRPQGDIDHLKILENGCGRFLSED